MIPFNSSAAARMRSLPVLLLALTLAPLGALHAAEAAGAAPGKIVALEGEALLRDWTPPVYPKAALRAHRGGSVPVRVIVDEHGRVTMARALEGADAEFVEAALAAVKSWGFEPGLSNGVPAPCCLDTRVVFSPKNGQQKPSGIPPISQQFEAATHKSPEAKATPSGPYPEVLTERKIPGLVKFRVTIDATGHVQHPVVLAASHVDFVLPALEALKQWEFQPAMQGDLPVSDGVETSVTYDSIAGVPGEIYTANGLTAPDGKAPEITPDPVAVADPVWPIDLLLAGKGGTATVEFTVGNDGAVRGVKVREATDPAFGQALAAAAQMWLFDKPIAHHETVQLPLAMHYEFKAIPLDATPDSDPLARIVLAMRHGEVGGTKGLDEKLTPICRMSPLYPDTLNGEAAVEGKAEIEFVIDREGRVRLPRIVSATREEFGWAAATAIQQWVFKVPHRGGVPADVRVKIPFTFKPPA